MVEVESDRKFMILGQSQVFFVDNSLKKLSAGTSEDFTYSDIRKVTYFTQFPNFFKLQLTP